MTTNKSTQITTNEARRGARRGLAGADEGNEFVSGVSIA